MGLITSFDSLSSTESNDTTLVSYDTQTFRIGYHPFKFLVSTFGAFRQLDRIYDQDYACCNKTERYLKVLTVLKVVQSCNTDMVSFRIVSENLTPIQFYRRHISIIKNYNLESDL